MSGFTRRTLLGTMGAAIVAACRPRRASSPDAAEDPPSEHTATLLEAIEQAGGLDFVRPGDRVLLKVNANSGDPAPYSTSPLVVATVAGLLRDRGARVVVGDRSFWGDAGTTANLEANGIAAAARSAAAELVAFDEAVPWVEIEPRLVPHWRPPFHVPRLAVEADHLINLACVKTHFITGVTLGLKNLLGLVRADDRARPGNLRVHHDEKIHHQIADVNRVLRPRLTIIDGYRALVSGGPTMRDGTPSIAAPGIVIADSDRVAAELRAITLLQRHAPATEAVHQTAPRDHPTLVAMRAGGLA